MINNFPFSDFMISVALFGVTLVVFFTKPYVGESILSNEADVKKNKIYKIMGTIGNYLILIGMTGQWISLIFLS